MGNFVFTSSSAINIHYTTSEFKYVVNRRGEAESINCIFKLASGVIILSRAAKPKKERKQRPLFTASSEPWFIKSIITIFILWVVGWPPTGDAAVRRSSSFIV